MGARLGGATKELLPNLDTYKNNEKSSIPLRFLFLGGCFGEANLLIFVRPSVRPCRRPPVKIQVVIGVFLGTKNQDTSPDTFCAEPPQNARSSPLAKIPVEGLDCKKIPSSSPLAKNSDRGTGLHKNTEKYRAVGRPTLHVQKTQADSRPSLHVESSRADSRVARMIFKHVEVGR